MVLEQLLKTVPMKRVIAIGVGSGVATGLIVSVSLQVKSELPNTMSATWNAATEDYRKYQNMDPVLSS
ncbi:unnamed protein product [Pylaiella littoralis]